MALKSYPALLHQACIPRYSRIPHLLTAFVSKQARASAHSQFTQQQSVAHIDPIHVSCMISNRTIFQVHKSARNRLQPFPSCHFTKPQVKSSQLCQRNNLTVLARQTGAIYRVSVWLLHCTLPFNSLRRDQKRLGKIATTCIEVRPER
jgi:hypothetical protein